MGSEEPMRHPRKVASSKQPGGTGAEAHGWESASCGAERLKSTGLFNTVRNIYCLFKLKTGKIVFLKF